MVILTHELVTALSAAPGNGRERQERRLDGGGGGRARPTQWASATAVDLCHEPPGPEVLLEVDPKVTGARVHRNAIQLAVSIEGAPPCIRWRVLIGRASNGIVNAR
jgi:hypothetical protein